MPEIQKEFFNQEGEKKRKRGFFPHSEGKQFFFSPSLDTLLLSMVMLIMGVVIIYAIGVEVGQQEKRRAVRKETPPLAVSVRPLPKREEPKSLLPSKKEAVGKYTIQVASFTKKETAEQALGKLKKEKGGIDAYLILGSQQVALCVGAYETRAEANRALSEFQKRYHDSFVRNR